MPMRLKTIAEIECDSCGRSVRISEDSLVPHGNCTDFEDMLFAELTQIYHWTVEFDRTGKDKKRFTCDSCNKRKSRNGTRMIPNPR